VEFVEEFGGIDAVKAFFYVSIEYPFGFLPDVGIDSFDGIMGRSPWSEAIRVRLKVCLPFRFERHCGQGLCGSIVYGGNAQWPLVRIAGFRDPDPSGGASVLV
jgi:hypothetical protein